MDDRGENVVTDECLQTLAGKMGEEWDIVGRGLGLDNAGLQRITQGYKGGPIGRNCAMLEKWKNKAVDKATYKVLAKALEKAERNDLAQKLLKGEFDGEMEPGAAISPTPAPSVPTPLKKKVVGKAEVTREDILELSGQLTHEWMEVGSYLGVPEPQLDSINDENKRRKAAISEMLRRWKMLQGTEATYAALANALRRAGRTDLAQKLPM